MRKCWLLLCLVPAGAFADERILDFHSDIVVMDDAWIEVTETIRVRAEGQRIRRGIYRDFPTRYEDRLGNRYEVDFEPLAVLRNDRGEEFHSQSLGNGVRVYFGREDRFIESGVHTYTFRYRASRMLGFFADHDELYWNVTGFDWAFPIDRARATVSFRFSVPPAALNHEAYTGPYGATGRDYRSWVDSGGRVHFESNRPLSAVNGLTIVVGWPKGLVAEPTDLQQFLWLLEDNANLLVTLLGLVLLLGYYVPVWHHFGRDPEVGVLVTRYEPPDGFSPASLRYIRQMYYDDKVMTAAIVNLAVKGYLRIDASEPSPGFLGIGARPARFSLVRLEPGPLAPTLAAGERELLQALFRLGPNVELDNENHELLGAAKSAHRESLQRDYRQHYFRTNAALNLPALAIVVGTAVVALRIGPSLAVILAIVLMVATTVAFAVAMYAPTLRGRRLLDEMLGFKDYLEVAEKDEMNLRNPPEKTPQLFEAFLPYALALGVDQQWAEKFAGVLAAAGQAQEAGYRPGWYGGSFRVSDLASSTAQLSTSLNTAVSSSVRPPGSSSGGGGGGSSGGGGGGGGGGGW